MNDDPHSAEEAVELFLARRRRGEQPDPADFARGFAHLGSDVAAAIEALVALESASSTPDDELAIPARIGAYAVRREIGRGGMGVVLEAIEEPLGRRVALKVLPPHALESPQARARFRREAELAARLDHPGIATVYATGVADDRPWIAMRFVEGRTLAQAIAQARASHASCASLPAAPRDADARADRAARDAGPLAIAACVARIARALQAAHEQGVVHRDVKPSNVIVTPDGTPVLVDFGLAIPEDSDAPTLTRTGDTAGTPAYMAPEIVTGERSRPDPQTDVYAAGVALYECLTLRRPFDAPTPVALYRSIAAGTPDSVRAANPAVPRDLAVVVATALERDRARRYRSAAAFADDLEACVARRPIAARPLPLAGRVLRWAHREPRQAALVGLLAAASIALAAFGGQWWNSRPQVLAAERASHTLALEADLEQGYANLQSGRVSDAEEFFERALARSPHSVEARVGRVLSSFGRKDDAGARARLAEVPAEERGVEALRSLVEKRPVTLGSLASIPPDSTALDLYIRGLCAHYDANARPFSARRPILERALTLFTEAVVRAPAPRFLYHQHRAMNAAMVGDARAARSAAAALTQLWPKSAPSLYAAGFALYAVDPAAARALIERSLEIDPRPLDAYNMLVQTCLAGGDIETAYSACQRGLARHPRSAPLLFLLGQVEVQRGCTPEARTAYESSLALQPDLVQVWAQLALADLAEGDDALAVERYQRALEADPLNHRVRLFYGAALERTGEVDAARRNVEFACAGLYPADDAVWRSYGGMFLQLRAHESALIVAETGLAASPDDPELDAILTGALNELGR